MNLYRLRGYPPKGHRCRCDDALHQHCELCHPCGSGHLEKFALADDARQAVEESRAAHSLREMGMVMITVELEEQGTPVLASRSS